MEINIIIGRGEKARALKDLRDTARENRKAAKEAESAARARRRNDTAETQITDRDAQREWTGTTAEYHSAERAAEVEGATRRQRRAAKRRFGIMIVRN